ncbi:MAG: hypothetical protein OEY92_00370 [Elusimicrobiota bacterium]|nr:hypothetical protein [Elusimicrobiota bacterium]
MLTFLLLSCSKQAKFDDEIKKLEQLHKIHPEIVDTELDLILSYSYTGSINKSLQLIEEKMGQSEKSPKLLSYYGHILFRKALIAKNVIQKLRYAKKAFCVLDKAVYEYPNCAICYLIRGIDSIEVSKYLIKRKQKISFLYDRYISAKEDLGTALELIKRVNDMDAKEQIEAIKIFVVFYYIVALKMNKENIIADQLYKEYKSFFNKSKLLEKNGDFLAFISLSDEKGKIQ